MVVILEFIDELLPKVVPLGSFIPRQPEDRNLDFIARTFRIAPYLQLRRLHLCGRDCEDKYAGINVGDPDEAFQPADDDGLKSVGKSRYAPIGGEFRFRHHRYQRIGLHFPGMVQEEVQIDGFHVRLHILEAKTIRIAIGRGDIGRVALLEDGETWLGLTSVNGTSRGSWIWVWTWNVSGTASAVFSTMPPPYFGSYRQGRSIGRQIERRERRQ